MDHGGAGCGDETCGECTEAGAAFCHALRPTPWQGSWEAADAVTRPRRCQWAQSRCGCFAVEGDLCAQHAIWAAFDRGDLEQAEALRIDHGMSIPTFLRIQRDAAEYRERQAEPRTARRVGPEFDAARAAAVAEIDVRGAW
jgi:hypothetical protein